MINIRPFQVSDLNIFPQNGQTAKLEIIRQAYDHSTILSGWWGQYEWLLGIGGLEPVMRNDHGQTICEAWMMLTPYIQHFSGLNEEIGIKILYGLRRLRKQIQPVRIHALVEPKPENMRLVEALRFRLESQRLRKMARDGGDCRLYAWVED